MAELNEIDYQGLIDRLVQDLRPVKRLWPVSVRLSLWILLQAALLLVVVLLEGRLDVFLTLIFIPIGSRGRRAFFFK